MSGVHRCDCKMITPAMTLIVRVDKPLIEYKGAKNIKKMEEDVEFSCQKSCGKMQSVAQGLNSDCLSLCICSPRFNLWRVQPDVLCNDVVRGMTPANRETVARMQILFRDGASACVRTWHRRGNSLSYCSSHVGAVKCEDGQPCQGSHSSAAAARRMTDTLYHAP